MSSEQARVPAGRGIVKTRESRALPWTDARLPVEMGAPGKWPGASEERELLVSITLRWKKWSLTAFILF